MKKFKIILIILFIILGLAICLTGYSLAKYAITVTLNANAKIAKPVVNMVVQKYNSSDLVHPYAIVTITNFTQDTMNDVVLDFTVSLSAENGMPDYKWYDMKNNLLATNAPITGTLGYAVEQTYQYKVVFSNNGEGDGEDLNVDVMSKNIDFSVRYVQVQM